MTLILIVTGVLLAAAWAVLLVLWGLRMAARWARELGPDEARELARALREQWANDDAGILLGCGDTAPGSCEGGHYDLIRKDERGGGQGTHTTTDKAPMAPRRV